MIWIFQRILSVRRGRASHTTDQTHAYHHCKLCQSPPETHKFKVQDQQNQTNQYQCSTIVIPHLVFMFLEVNGKESAADTPIRISTWKLGWSHDFCTKILLQIHDYWPKFPSKNLGLKWKFSKLHVLWTCLFYPSYTVISIYGTGTKSGSCERHSHNVYPTLRFSRMHAQS